MVRIKKCYFFWPQKSGFWPENPFFFNKYIGMFARPGYKHWCIYSHDWIAYSTTICTSVKRTCHWIRSGPDLNKKPFQGSFANIQTVSIFWNFDNQISWPCERAGPAGRLAARTHGSLVTRPALILPYFNPGGNNLLPFCEAIYVTKNVTSWLVGQLKYPMHCATRSDRCTSTICHARFWLPKFVFVFDSFLSGFVPLPVLSYRTWKKIWTLS